MDPMEHPSEASEVEYWTTTTVDRSEVSSQKDRVFLIIPRLKPTLRHEDFSLHLLIPSVADDLVHNHIMSIVGST